LKNSNAIFQAGDARRRVKHAVIDYEIQIMAANRGLPQRLCAVTLEKWFYHFSSYLIIKNFKKFFTAAHRAAAPAARRKNMDRITGGFAAEAAQAVLSLIS